MSLYKNQNWAYAALPEIENDSVFVGCNLVRAVANTAIFAGKTGLHFVNCNLMNCVAPSGAVVEDCLTVQKSLCYWLHLSDDGANPLGLAVENENCEHVTTADNVMYNGTLVDTIYTREDKVLQ